jgi:hypothetical protein
MINRFYSWPIRVHLTILIALLAVPSISLIIHSGMAERREAIAGAKTEVLKLVNEVAGRQQGIVAGAEQLAAALSLLPPIQSRNPATATALFSGLLKKNPQYTNIAVCDVLKRKDNTEVSIDVSGALIRDPGGEAMGVVLVFRDMTERKRTDKALRENYEELTRFNRAAVGRELRMIELKKEVNRLCIEAGLPTRYTIGSEPQDPEDRP